MNWPRIFLLAGVIALSASLSACASLDFASHLAHSSQVAKLPVLAEQHSEDVEKKQAREQQIASLLEKEVGQEQALHLALLNSASLQALLAKHQAQLNLAKQAGRIANPLFTLERTRGGGELEIGRSLALGLFDLLSWPARQEHASHVSQQAELQLSVELLDQATQIRRAWVQAVAARAMEEYAQRVLDSADAAAELAQKMESVGNLSQLARARQQVFYADAAARLSQARQRSVQSREVLIRLIGLSESQASRLRLPQHLPALPLQARQPQEVTQTALAQRLDVRLAQAELAAAASLRGIQVLHSLGEAELGLHRESSAETKRGIELSLPLPLFDLGQKKRLAQDAELRKLEYQLQSSLQQANSHLRQAYAAYRSTHEIALHYQQEILPLRQTIAQETLLRYNGMLVGVFELLAEAREQAGVVQEAIAAAQDFWLADADLQSGMLGRPLDSSPPARTNAAPANSPAH